MLFAFNVNQIFISWRSSRSKLTRWKKHLTLDGDPTANSTVFSSIMRKMCYLTIYLVSTIRIKQESRVLLRETIRVLWTAPKLAVMAILKLAPTCYLRINRNSTLRMN